MGEEREEEEEVVEERETFNIDELLMQQTAQCRCVCGGGGSRRASIQFKTFRTQRSRGFSAGTRNMHQCPAAVGKKKKKMVSKQTRTALNVLLLLSLLLLL